MKHFLVFILLLPIFVLSKESPAELLRLIKNGDTSYVVAIPSGQSEAFTTETDTIIGKKGKIIKQLRGYDKSIPPEKVIEAVSGKTPLLENTFYYTSPNNFIFKKTKQKSYAKCKETEDGAVVIKNVQKTKALPTEVLSLGITSFLMGIFLATILFFDRLSPKIKDLELMLIIIGLAILISGGIGIESFSGESYATRNFLSLIFGIIIFFIAFIIEFVIVISISCLFTGFKKQLSRNDFIAPCVAVVFSITSLIPIYFKSPGLILPAILFIFFPGLISYASMHYIVKKTI